MKDFNTFINENSSKISEGDIVKIVLDADTEKTDPKFFKKYDGQIARINQVNPVSGYKGYSVDPFDGGGPLTLDQNEVIKLKGAQLQRALKKYE